MLQPRFYKGEPEYIEASLFGVQEEVVPAVIVLYVYCIPDEWGRPWQCLFTAFQGQVETLLAEKGVSLFSVVLPGDGKRQ